MLLVEYDVKSAFIYIYIYIYVSLLVLTSDGILHSRCIKSWSEFSSKERGTRLDYTL